MAYVQTDKRLLRWLDDAGIDYREAKRVVIDMTIDEIVTVYVERYADSRLMDAKPPRGAFKETDEAPPNMGEFLMFTEDRKPWLPAWTAIPCGLLVGAGCVWLWFVARLSGWL